MYTCHIDIGKWDNSPLMHSLLLLVYSACTLRKLQASCSVDGHIRPLPPPPHTWICGVRIHHASSPPLSLQVFMLLIGHTFAHGMELRRTEHPPNSACTLVACQSVCVFNHFLIYTVQSTELMKRRLYRTGSHDTKT